MKIIRKNCIWLLLLLAGLVQPIWAQPEGLLYSFSKPGGPTHYLFGTMHSDNAEVLALLDAVHPRLQTADLLVQEMPMDLTSIAAASMGMMLPADTRLRQKIGAELYEKVASMAQRKGLPMIALDRMKVWAVAVSLATPPPADDVLDQALYKRALQLGKPVYGLETADEQLSLFDELSLDMQVTMLSDVLAKEEEMETQFQSMIEAYLAGDLDRLQALSMEYESGGDVELARWFRQRVLIFRNQRMLTRLPRYLQKGAAFVAVGALHLPGNDGLLAGLRKQGFIVQPVRVER